MDVARRVQTALRQPLQRLARPAVERMMLRALRRAFRRIVWTGPRPHLPADRPVVLYMNHHNFYDGYLAWLIIDRVLEREGITWMAEWHRFPPFSAAGALPFPRDDERQRAQTVRRTARRMARTPNTALAYFPEGSLHRPEEGIQPFSSAPLRRLERLFPPLTWLPLGLHVTWWGEATPTVVLGGGPPHDRIDGEEHPRLDAVWQAVRSAPPASCDVLFEGRHDVAERWSLAALEPLFRPID